MAHNQTTRLDPLTKAMLYAYHNIANNKYYFTFQGKGYPEEEEYGHLGFIEPYFTEVNPKRPLGRPLNHTEDPNTLLPIPKLLPANCLDRKQYPWNILCQGADGWDWDSTRHSLYQDFNVSAYKSKQPSNQDRPSAAPFEMSTVTENALQTSYP